MQFARQSTGGGRFRISDPQRIGRQSISRTSSDPTLVLDLQFQRDAAFVSRRGPLPTFTRASAATCVNSAGLVVSAAINTPRIDYDPTTLASRGLLIEEQRTNLATWSEDLSNAAWVKTNTTVSANQGVAPDGAATMDLLVETTTNAQHYVRPVVASITSGTAYTGSFFIKKGTGVTAPDWVAFTFPTAGFGSQTVAFNVSTGAFGAVTGTLTYRATQFINGVWRVYVTATATSTSVNGCVFVAFTNNTNTSSLPTYAGQTTSDIFVWGAQFEAGAFATSYIPTTSAAVVRSADVCSITGSAFSGFWNASEGTIALKLQKGYAVPASISQLNYLSVNDGTSNNYIQLCQRGSGTTGEVFRVETGGVSQALLQASASIIAANAAFGLAGVYKANDVRASCNGGTVVSDTTATVPTLNVLQFVTVTSALWISSLQCYNIAKTNAQLQALSTP